MIGRGTESCAASQAPSASAPAILNLGSSRMRWLRGERALAK